MSAGAGEVPSTSSCSEVAIEEHLASSGANAFLERLMLGAKRHAFTKGDFRREMRPKLPDAIVDVIYEYTGASCLGSAEST